MRHAQIVCVVLWAVLGGLPSALATELADAVSVRQFVQQFYDWYAPIAQEDQRKRPAAAEAIERRKSSFSPELWSALKEDLDAQAKSREIVGIDWDPFLNSQDPCEKYSAGAVKEQGGLFLVEVFMAACGDGAKLSGPAVVANIRKSGKAWQFTNFTDPEHHVNLMEALKVLKQERTRAPGAKKP